MRDFIAIDVETANEDLATICAIGVVVYTDGAVTGEIHSLVNLGTDDFSNSWVHGITAEDVASAPPLDKVMEIAARSILGCDLFIVAHTSFDRTSFTRAFEGCGLPPPQARWIDSCRVARRVWQELPCHGLAEVSEHLGYRFQHHNALEDAKAAGNVILQAMAKTSLDVEGLVALQGRPVGSSEGGAITRDGNPEGPLYGEVLVFTGALAMPRREAADMAAKVGCEVGAGVTKKTTLLVVGDQDLSKLAGHETSEKHRKALALIKKGQPIRILGESDFRRIVAAG